MIIAILQARMSSSRLPGKVLKPILDRPMLQHQVERLRRAETVDVLVVATSDRPSDDPLAELCAAIGVDVFRGSLDDVLDRFHRCATAHGADQVVRLTGDCPLADPELVDALVRFHLDGDFDYSANCRPPTLPDGLDAEIFTMEALGRAHAGATTSHEREHVVPYIINRPGDFAMGNWSLDGEDHSGLRWTVDEPEDLVFVRAVFEALYPGNPAFTWRDVLRLVRQRPQLAALNAHHERNAGSRPGG